MTLSIRRRTKILATLGPASDGALKMEELLRAGVDLFRVNFSHGTHEQHAVRIAAAREAEKAHGHPIALLADLQGPKLRVGDILNGQCDIRISSELRLIAAPSSNEPDVIPIPHPELVASLQLGDRLLIDDGKMMLVIVKVDGADRIARPIAPGRILSQQVYRSSRQKTPSPRRFGAIHVACTDHRPAVSAKFIPRTRNSLHGSCLMLVNRPACGERNVCSARGRTRGDAAIHPGGPL